MNISNVSPVKFQGVYLNPRAEDTVNDWVNINNRRLTKDVLELKKATDAYKTDVVILPGGDGEYGAQVIEVKDVCDGNNYRVVDYLSEEDKLPDALEKALKKLNNKYEVKDKPTRQRFPGRANPGINTMA